MIPRPPLLEPRPQPPFPPHGRPPLGLPTGGPRPLMGMMPPSQRPLKVGPLCSVHQLPPCGVAHNSACATWDLVILWCMVYVVYKLQGPPPQELPPPGNQKEVWFEHMTKEGKPYYSNPQTHQTSWERPQDAQIITPPAPGTGCYGIQ